MALIDQRILIDAPPHVIWEFISDPDKVPRWHAGYSGVSVLTTQRTGAGTRRRCSLTGGGKDVIEEITTWVEGLGYEYRLVESTQYRSFQGRLRLQIGPDGTTVQWTVSYRRKGLLGFIQDQMKGRRIVAQMIADSLRQLRRQVDALGVRMDDSQRAKAGIQGRLDANARAQYQRKYAPPPGLEPAAPQTPPEGSPAVSDIPAAAVPSFVDELTQEAGGPDFSSKVDTKPRKPEGLREAIAAQHVESPAPETRVPTPPEPVPPVSPLAPMPTKAPQQPKPEAPAPEFRPPVAEHKRITPAHGTPIVRPEPGEPSADVPTQPKPPREPASELTPNAERRATIPPQTPVHDTGEISIWEVFGVKRPSEQDDETLKDLIRSVRKKKAGPKRRIGRRVPRRAMRVRRVETVVGLRVWLALRSARIRLNESLYGDWE